jgi:hypothetical protein
MSEALGRSGPRDILVTEQRRNKGMNPKELYCN